MANPEHVQLVQRADWNKWRMDHADILLELSKADLRGAVLRETDLSGAVHEAALREAVRDLENFDGAVLSGAVRGADLSGAILGGADLSRANLREVDLRGAVLSRAVLCRADLSGAVLASAVLRGAILVEANLREAVLTEADLSGANFTKAWLDETVFGDTDLRGANGLDGCTFAGPCTLDHRTIQRSGRLPLPFLRGCGLPDLLIEYLPSLSHEAIQFFSCFISYSTADQTFAERLYADLQSKGVRCWFAPHNIQGGQKIHAQIDQAIRVYDKLLLILSDASMNSRWVETEIANARAREEQQKRQMLFPIALIPFDRIKDWRLFDVDRGLDSAREIRQYFIPDFTEWKDHDSYAKAFGRLLQDLKAIRA